MVRFLAATLTLAPLSAIADETHSSRPIDVVVVESHHHVLPYWIEAVEAGVIPHAGVQVVHVDAHPDLAVPAQPVDADWPSRRDSLTSRLDIASFQLAAARIGLVNEVLWLRPDWARQLPDGERTLRLGVLPDGRLRTDDSSSYYVLADGWAPTVWLRELRSLRLRVAPLSDPGLDRATASTPWILDVDLDVFATRNPAATRLRAAGLSDPDLDVLRGVFSPANLELPSDPEERIQTLSRLNAAAEALVSGGLGEWIRAARELWRIGVGPLDILRVMRVLGRAADLPAEDLLWHARKVVTVPESPETTEEEMQAQREAILGVVRTLGPPALITVARSLHDGFTPVEVARRAEPELLRDLQAQLGRVRVRWHPGLRAFDPPRAPD